jgi:hypothetical protein
MENRNSDLPECNITLWIFFFAYNFVLIQISCFRLTKHSYTGEWLVWAPKMALQLAGKQQSIVPSCFLEPNISYRLVSLGIGCWFLIALMCCMSCLSINVIRKLLTPWHVYASESSHRINFTPFNHVYVLCTEAFSILQNIMEIKGAHISYTECINCVWFFSELDNV